MAIDIRDWFGSPREWGAFGTKVNYWLNQLVDEVRSIRTAVTTAQAEVDALETATAAVSTSSLLFASGVGHYGGDYQDMVCTKTRDGMVTISGLILNSSGIDLAAGTAVVQVEAAYAPPEILLFTSRIGAGSMRIDIKTNGQILVQATWTNTNFLSLECTYKAA